MFVLFEIENKNKNMSHVQTKKKKEEQQGEQSPATSQSRWAEVVGEKGKKREKEITQEMLVVKLKYSSQHLVNLFFKRQNPFSPSKRSWLNATSWKHSRGAEVAVARLLFA